MTPAIEDTDGHVAVEVEVSAATARGRQTLLRLLWRQEDPLAVVLVLRAQPDHPALPRGSWAILRDFLRYGLEEPTGDGSVRIRPDEVRDVVWFELDGTGRPCCVAVPRPVARAFLDRTELRLPSGEEQSDEALDRLIERLLAT